MTEKYVNQSTDDYDVLVTGATGLFGRWLVPELTRRGSRVLGVVRDADRRSSELRTWIAAHGGDPTRADFIQGDLDQPGLDISAADRARLGGVRQVFHLGAGFSWHMDLAAARRTNVDGTIALLELAVGLPALERVVLLGGYRSCERVRDGQRYLPSPREFEHVGSYERSKYESLLRGRERAQQLGLPLSVLHPCAVIGDSRTGETTQLLGVGELIVALARGQMPARVGSPRTLVPLVSVDMVARVLAEMASDPALRGRELVLLDPRTPVLDQLVDRAAEVLGVRAPRMRVPLWLARSLPEWLTKNAREALDFIDDARYPTEETDAWLAERGLSYPQLEPAFDRWVLALAREHVPGLVTPRTAVAL